MSQPFWGKSVTISSFLPRDLCVNRARRRFGVDLEENFTSKKWRRMQRIRHHPGLKKAVGDFPPKSELGKPKSILISSKINVIDGIKQFQMPMDKLPTPLLEVRGTISPIISFFFPSFFPFLEMPVIAAVSL